MCYFLIELDDDGYKRYNSLDDVIRYLWSEDAIDGNYYIMQRYDDNTCHYCVDIYVTKSADQLILKTYQENVAPRG